MNPLILLLYQSLSIADNSKATQQHSEHNHFWWTSFMLCSSNMYKMVVHLDINAGLD